MLEIISNTVVSIAFLVYWIIAFITFYHLTRFGVGTQPKKFAVVFLFGAVAIFCISLVTYIKIDFNSLPTW